RSDTLTGHKVPKSHHCGFWDCEPGHRQKAESRQPNLASALHHPEAVPAGHPYPEECAPSRPKPLAAIAGTFPTQDFLSPPVRASIEADRLRPRLRAAIAAGSSDRSAYPSAARILLGS